jgi:hypothetical protein
MKSVAVFVLFAFLGQFLLAGCAFAPAAPVYGGLLTNGTRGPVAGVDNSVRPQKKGVSIAEAILFYAYGDASIVAAMREGNIQKVHHVDCEVFTILGLYATYKTIVYGE